MTVKVEAFAGIMQNLIPLARMQSIIPEDFLPASSRPEFRVFPKHSFDVSLC